MTSAPLTGRAASTPGATRIVGTGHYVPERVVTNDELAGFVDTSDDWIRSRTGIRERRFAAADEHTSDLASEAARRALDAAGITASELDLIIVATVTPDMPLPSTAVFVQRAIGARADCPAFDLAAACAGFIYGLSVGDRFIRTGGARHVLVVGVELLSRVLDWRDRTTCVLFGDGAGAVVLAAGSPPGILSTHLFADGGLADALTIPAGGSRRPADPGTVAEGLHTVHMDGQGIFKVAVRSLAAACETALRHNDRTPDEVDWVVPHQANLRILEGVSQRVGIPMSRFYVNIARFGNTSSASVPIALDEGIRSEAIRPGQLLLFTALGGGVAWGSALLEL
ncbi:MAG TPA: beta-ketoacyl-ACP synthase III [Polyangiaceae bacterium LLY-WYZ-14_1]|nr:beta-ketoacyl-ACP synthase III [Polyangiaceae bacterium LLY-WYZ-14_1]